MLAAEDPHNPVALRDFSRYSLSLYANFLTRIQALSGIAVSFQTSLTIQHTPAGPCRLAERSLDPRQLGLALVKATRAASVRIVENAAIARVDIQPAEVAVHSAT